MQMYQKSKIIYRVKITAKVDLTEYKAISVKRG